jgi:hypothetical protein
MRAILREDDPGVGPEDDTGGAGERARRGGLAVRSEGIVAGAGERGHGVGSEVEQPHAIVVTVGYEKVAARVERQRGGVVELRGAGRAVREARDARAGDGGDCAATDSAHFADDVVQRVADVEAAAGNREDARRRVELRHERAPRDVVAAESWGAAARHGKDRAQGVDAADLVVVAVGDEDAARAVRDGVGRRVEEGGRRRPAVTCGSGRVLGARYPRDESVRSDHAANRVRLAIGDDQIAGGCVVMHPQRALEFALVRRHAVASTRDGARDRRDHAGVRIDAPDARVLTVGDQHRAVGREIDPEGSIESRGSRQAAVTDLPPHERADLQLSPGQPNGDEECPRRCPHHHQPSTHP